MANTIKAPQIDLGDLIEVSTKAIERALEARLPFPIGTTIGIIFNPPFPGQFPAAVAPGTTIGGVSIPAEFLRSLAARAGEFHGRFVREALGTKPSQAARAKQALTQMQNLQIVTSGESQNIERVLDLLRNDAIPLKDPAALATQFYSHYTTERGTKGRRNNNCSSGIVSLSEPI